MSPKTKLFSFYQAFVTFVKKRPKLSLFWIISVIFYLFFCLPNPLFRDPLSAVLEDEDGKLMGARVAADGQWRFPDSDSLPEKFVKCLVEFEDKRFFYHFGFDPISFGRAFLQNIKNQRVVSGGSTLTMQIIRMSRKGKSRNLYEKLVELLQATRLELTNRKKTILNLYASNAPFGGNVVGLEAASWRYFGKNPNLLTWAEAATLAVLPNNPALIHVGRNRDILLNKRNKLLDRLSQKNIFDRNTCELAKEEPLPNELLALPQLAPHFLDKIVAEKKIIQRFQSTLKSSLQINVTGILARHQQILKANDIHNLAAIVLEVETGKVLAYVGNAVGAGAEHGAEIDMIKAPRSTGSVLKPILLSLMMDEGLVLPNSLISDIPSDYGGYQPENFHQTYDGVVTARRALVRSLNIPFIRLLQKYSLDKFHFKLQKFGLSTLNPSATYYGLPLILGGAEATLWDITNIYANMSRTLKHYYKNNGKYLNSDIHQIEYISEKKKLSPKKETFLDESPMINAGALWQIFDCMQEVERPDAEGNWEAFRGSKRIAWKTGTSFGFRDAWAIGTTPKYVVGVWAGNADCEGRPGLIGLSAAAPVLFDIFDQLETSEWFDFPGDDLVKVSVCKQSGYRPLEGCEIDSVWGTKATIQKLAACPYHQLVYLDKSGQFRVSSDCLQPSEMTLANWFVLPPIEEFYYKSKNPNYQELPKFLPICDKNTSSENPMQMIYPKLETKIFIPIDLDGKSSSTVFKVAHRRPETTIYWHIDQDFVGSTNTFHELSLQPSLGQHRLTLVDAAGNRLEQNFEVIGKDKK